MFRKIVTLFATLTAFSQAILTDNTELHRQYRDYRKVFRKEDIQPNGFENFVQNLNTIETNNKESRCRAYLTKDSDTKVGGIVFRC